MSSNYIPTPSAETMIDDWDAAHIAELFSIDVFPLDDTINHRLAQYFPNRIPIRHLETYETCATLLNYPDITFERYIEMPCFNNIVYTDPPTIDIPIHCYTYKQPGGAADGQDAFVHFFRTDQGETHEVSPKQFFNHYMFYTDPYLPMMNYPYPEPGIIWKARTECYTPMGFHFQKDVKTAYNGGGGLAWMEFAPGEISPGMLIMHEYDPTTYLYDDNIYTQGIQLYGDDYVWYGNSGWNTVSWHIEPPDPDTISGPLWMQDILPNDSTNAWFFDNDNGQVYTYDEGPLVYYPLTTGSGEWPWILNNAYKIHLDIGHFWQFDSRPRMDLEPFTFTPEDEWNPHNMDYRWFFMGYAAPGYTKLASAPNTPQTSSGDPVLFDYEGPFHWLIWENDPANNYPPYDLKIVTTDDGRAYIPTPTDLHDWVDQIGILEPGRGYHLGFLCDPNTEYSFDGWAGYPNWTNNSVNPEPKYQDHSIASTNHFQFKKYTQWFYPILIDTVDQEECPMSPGDEIGVFDGEMCVGAGVYSGEFPLVFPAWKDDIITPEKIDGYEDGNPMIFVWYDASENIEVEFVPITGISSVEDDPVAPTHSGFGCGFYALRSFTEGIQSTKQLPTEFRLCQNYPNPFNAETVIPLELPERSKVKIELFNIQGQRVEIIYERLENAGWPKIRYNASNLTSGVYFCRITAEGLERGGTYSSVGKMLLLK